MAERPLLILPTPEAVSPPRGGGGGSPIRLPPKDTQVSRLGPAFRRLRQVLDGTTTGAMELRDDPTSLAPDRVIVFEIAGTIADFIKAVARVPGFEFMAEYDTESPPDEVFAVEDTRSSREGEVRTDKDVAGRFYLAMPDVTALRQLVSLWERWERGQPLRRGYAPFRHLFSQLRTLRPWGPEDRISEETIAYWREELVREPHRPVRTEVDLWFHQSATRRQEASQSFASLVSDAGGEVVHTVTIPEIAYQGVLIDIPAGQLPALIERREVALALADEVMFLRPQSLLISPLESEPVEDDRIPDRIVEQVHDQPVAALLDGVPLQGHFLLSNRLILDDPDDLQSQAIVSRRFHGTAMASLILHGDLNAGQPSLDRPLYVRPLMFAPSAGPERTDGDRLLVDTIYRAVLRIKGGAVEEAAAPTVFLVNLSMGDPRRPFARLMSPLARLLDYLSDRFSILFLASAGNITTPLALPDFDTWADFENADPSARERAVLTALNDAKHERTLLSPAESLNALTIGAQHHDNIDNRLTTSTAVDPFDDGDMPNPSSALGLGYRRITKPDIYLPGGREHLRMSSSGGGVRAGFGPPQRLYGLSAAAPDPSAQGRLNQTAFSDGTSSATALATRAAHRIFDALMDRDGGSMLADIPSDYYALLVKSLLVHRARWSGKEELFQEICGPDGRYRSNERKENVSRFMGFGIPATDEALECSVNRATLVGYGSLQPDHAHSYRIPLPECLERVTDPRSLILTLAWLSPVRPGYQNYRSVKLEAAPHDPAISLGVKRFTGQPSDAAVKRGTVFHECYTGSRAVPFVDDGHLALRVWCREDAGGTQRPIRYAIAVTIEAETSIPVYDQIQQRLRVRPRVGPQSAI